MTSPGYSWTIFMVLCLCSRLGVVPAVLLAIPTWSSRHGFWAQCPPTSLSLFSAILPIIFPSLSQCPCRVARYPTRQSAVRHCFRHHLLRLSCISFLMMSLTRPGWEGLSPCGGITSSIVKSITRSLPRTLTISAMMQYQTASAPLQRLYHRVYFKDRCSNARKTN